MDISYLITIYTSLNLETPCIFLNAVTGLVPEREGEMAKEPDETRGWPAVGSEQPQHQHGRAPVCGIRLRDHGGQQQPAAPGGDAPPPSPRADHPDP